MPLSSPPVPTKLREMLEDYPGHIEQMQKALSSVNDRRLKSVPPFEAAVWALEDHLGGFISEARTELEAAEALGDPEAIVRADAKLRLMFKARSGGGGMLNISDLAAYFESHNRHA